MAKRFMDNELWDKEWFQELSLKHKCLFNYLCSECDCAGVWDANYRQASFVIGEKITEADILEINSIKKQFEILQNGNVFLVDFIKFQYNCEINELNPNFSVHKGIIAKLNKNSILETLTKPLQCNPSIVSLPMEDLQDKDKDMVKDKVKVKEPKKEYIQLKDVDYVNLTQEDFNKISEKYGTHTTLIAISALDGWLARATTPNAKKARGKPHKDYFRSDSWVWEKSQTIKPRQTEYVEETPKTAVAERG